MGTKLDRKFANGVVEGVSALILEVERLETLVNNYEEAMRLILIQRENFSDEAAKNIYKLANDALKQ